MSAAKRTSCSRSETREAKLGKRNSGRTVHCRDATLPGQERFCIVDDVARIRDFIT
ncbi:hypothetical protein [Methanosarcina mazei]|uniref:hypothetical protein n=1 Tax=Methanosarcina mazei TaxID=2209 RepID=UPI0012D3EB6C|nr:hypothetical protein [Methanosarcina mazei]MDY0247833.1 hypothetical protein [Methanosarcina mazei]WIM42549.1 hypothetical protein PSF70_13730 [Methanosarcina mazei]WIM46011.1 hypothetical protein PQQ20_13635 [Methanosarcina mazei]